MVALQVECRTSDQQVAGSTPYQALLAQQPLTSVHTLVPLSPSGEVGTSVKTGKLTAGYGRGVVYHP